VNTLADTEPPHVVGTPLRKRRPRNVGLDALISPVFTPEQDATVGVGAGPGAGIAFADRGVKKTKETPRARNKAERKRLVMDRPERQLERGA